MATRIPNTTLSQPISSLSRSSFAIAGPWWPIPWSEASAARNASSRCVRLIEAPHAFVAPSRSYPTILFSGYSMIPTAPARSSFGMSSRTVASAITLSTANHSVP